MDKLLDSIGRFYHSTLELFHIKKPEKPQEPQKPVAPPVTTLNPKETLEIQKTEKGAARAAFGKNTDEMIKDWVKKGINGNQVLPNLKDCPNPEQEVMKFINENIDDLVDAKSSKNPADLKERQEQFKSNVRNFMQEISKSDVTTSSGKKLKLIDSIRAGLRKDGITFEQLETLGKGDFSAEAYKQMVKTQGGGG